MARPKSTSLPYVPIDPHIDEHPKTWALVDALKEAGSELPAEWLIEVPSKIIRYCGRCAVDGIIGHIPDSLLVRIVPVDISGTSLRHALTSTGWLHDNEELGLVMHDWDQHGGQVLAKRKSDSEKKARQREREKLRKTAQSNASTGMSPGCHRDVPGCLPPEGEGEGEGEGELKNLSALQSNGEKTTKKTVTKKKKVVKWRTEKQTVLAAYKKISKREKYIPTAAYKQMDRIFGEGVSLEDVLSSLDYGWRNARLDDHGQRQDQLHHFLSEKMFPHYHSKATAPKFNPIEAKFGSFESYMAAGKGNRLDYEDQDDFDSAYHHRDYKYVPFQNDWEKYHAEQDDRGSQVLPVQTPERIACNNVQGSHGIVETPAVDQDAGGDGWELF